MTNATFLDQIATQLITNYSEDFSNIVVVLPNKRAKIFLIKKKKRQISGTVFCPEITSVEDFVQEVSGIRSIDSIALLFEFYEVYLSITFKQN